MAFIKDSIALKITNDTTFKATIPIMGGNNDKGQVNSNILYDYDLTLETFIGVTSVTIQVSTITNPVIQNYSITNTNVDSVKRVVDLLNTLNVGIFNYQGDIIWITSNVNIYGNLILS